ANTVTAEKYVIGTDSLAGTGYNNFYHMGELINYCGDGITLTYWGGPREVGHDSDGNKGYVIISSERKTGGNDNGYYIPNDGEVHSIREGRPAFKILNFMYVDEAWYKDEAWYNPNDHDPSIDDFYDDIYKIDNIIFEDFTKGEAHIFNTAINEFVSLLSGSGTYEDDKRLVGVEIEFICSSDRPVAEYVYIDDDNEPVTILGSCVEDGTQKGCSAYDKTSGYTEKDCVERLIYTELYPTEGVYCIGDVNDCYQNNNLEGYYVAGPYLECNSEALMYNEDKCNIQPGCMWISFEDYDFSTDCLDTIITDIADKKNNDSDPVEDPVEDPMEDSDNAGCVRSPDEIKVGCRFMDDQAECEETQVFIKNYEEPQNCISEWDDYEGWFCYESSPALRCDDPVFFDDYDKCTIQPGCEWQGAKPDPVCIGEFAPGGEYSCLSLTKDECDDINSEIDCEWNSHYESCEGGSGSCSSLTLDDCMYFTEGRGCKLAGSCESNVDCECGEICSAGECGAYAGPEIGHCDSDEECLGGYDCVHGECIENAKCYPGGKFSAASGATGYPVYIGIGAIVLVAGFWYYIDSTKKKPKRRKSKRKRRK
ncbi:hypothetical protein HN510_02090, partial [Candidatus Woesearchaeota archaeon]|nr:hypothetical protein [Candidatus Woesearchaeota archaeon]